MAGAGRTLSLTLLLAAAAVVDGLLHAPPCQDGVWACVRGDLADSLGRILVVDQFNVTPSLVVERVRYPDSDVDVERMATSLNEGGLPTLASTAVKVFETHALVWKLWPGMLHFKIFRDPDEGMDAAVEVPPSEGSRTWGLGAIAARRRLTMALLPIMFKMGVMGTLLGVLVFIALKTMFMVSILFVLAVSSFAKHKLSGLHSPHYAPPLHKEVHVHVHADHHKQAYGGWHRYNNHGLQDIGGGYNVFPPYQTAPPADYYEEPSHHYLHNHRRASGPSPYSPVAIVPPTHSSPSRWQPLTVHLDPAAGPLDTDSFSSMYQ